MIPALEKDSVVRKGKIRNQKAAIVAIAKKPVLPQIAEASEESSEVSLQLIDIDKEVKVSSSSDDGSSSEDDIEKREILPINQKLEIK